MAKKQNRSFARHTTESLGRSLLAGLKAIPAGVEVLGFGVSVLSESLFWLGLGKFRRHPVSVRIILEQMMEIGVRAIPIGTVLSLAMGITLALQRIYLLRMFGAESQVVLSVVLAVVREFPPLVMGILVASRSGSALTTQLASMIIAHGPGSLKTGRFSPIQSLVSPALLATMIMLPLLTLWSILITLASSSFYAWYELGMSFDDFSGTTLQILTVSHLIHGLCKTVIFATLIVIIAAINGLSVSSGADSVVRATTRSVVFAISAIIVTDMLFVLLMTHI